MATATGTTVPTAAPSQAAIIVTNAPPTATSSATPTPAPTLQACAVAAAAPLVALWQEQRAQLGCPVNQLVTSDAAAQGFQHGVMLWRKSNDMIYVLYDEGDWAAYPDISVDGEPEPAGFDAPPGLVTPVRGFGATWRTRLGGTGARIGWATEQEYAVSIQVQDFEHGLIFLPAGGMNGAVYLLGDDGGRSLVK